MAILYNRRTTLLSVCGVNARGNKEQAELIRLILQNDIKIVYCIGNAGTGKTFISLATALQMIYKVSYEFLLKMLPEGITEDRLQDYFVGDSRDFSAGGCIP